MSDISSHPAADPQPAASVTASPAPASPAEVFDRLLHGVCDRRWDELPGLYAAHTHVVHPLDPHRSPPLLTPEALARHFEVAAKVLGDVRFAPANVTVHQTTDPEVVIGEFEYLATVPGIAEPFPIPNIFVIRVRDGQIVQSRDYADYAQFGLALAARDANNGAAGPVSPDGNWRARAQRRYEDAAFADDAAGLAAGDRELDAVEAGLALARGRILHGRWLTGGEPDDQALEQFEHAAQLYGKLGDTRGEAEALFWVATFHQAVRGDHETALPLLERAGELAAAAGDLLTLSYVARHLGFVHDNAGRPELARQRLEESLRLRREIDFQPGVAAALLALAEFAAGHGGQAETESLLNEAQQTAGASGARGVQRRIDSFRTAS
jgi:ketosteroid isomerase-like protein